MKLIIGMTGATGAPLGVALLQALRDMPEVETHLVMSKWAKTTIELETPWTAREVAALADFSHSPADQGRHHLFRFISYRRHDRYSLQYENAGRHSRGVMPKGWWAARRTWCSKRGASWCWSRGEMPLSTIHLENMLALSRMGVAMVPPMPAYYNHPETVDDITNHIVTRVLDQFGLDYHKARRWNGLRTAEQFAQEIE